MSKNGAPKHILVINDTPAILDLFRALLEDEGYRVSTDNFSAVDLGAKLEKVRRLTPDAIILDFIIDGEPIGWQFLQLLKMDRDATRIPVVVCTAAVHRVEELGPHLRTLGVQIVIKPFEIDHVLGALTRAFNPTDGPLDPESP